MADLRAYQPSFTGGELSPALGARIDLAKYTTGLRTALNVFVHPHGGVSNRAGLEFVHEIRDSAQPARLIKFQFNTEQTYVLEFGNNYIRIFRDGGLILSGALPYEVVTTYTSSDVKDLVFVQEADVLYLCHVDHPVRKLGRLADDNWTLTPVEFKPLINAPAGAIDARDADFVQSVWDYAGSFKADIAAREKRVTGVTPQWVETAPVVIGGKKLAGGYYPLRNNTSDVAQALVAGQFAKAQTNGLHGRQQEDQPAPPLELDMSVLHQHINALVHDLELSEVVANTGRLLRDERIQAAFIQTGKGADHAMLQGWLRDAATGNTSGAALLSGTARFAKDNVTAARLATELGSAITQMSGLSEAMSSIGQEQFAVDLQTALRPGVMRRVAALSPFMSSRQGSFENSSGGSNTPLGGLSNWVMQRLNYQMVEVPVWLAGYHQGLDTYRRNEAKAISHADRLVKQLQTSRDGTPSDNAMTSPQGREIETLLTALGALMTAKSGTGENSVPQGKMPVSNNAAEGIALAIDIVALFHTDAVLKAVAHSKSPSGDVVSALSIAETMPFFRDAESSKTGAPRRGKAQRYNDNNGTKRLAGMISASGVLNDIDTAGLMATLNTTGLSFGLPATQISQVVEARMPQTKGGDTSLMQLLTTRTA